MEEVDDLCFDPASIPRTPDRQFAALPTDEEIASRITLDDATFDRAKVAWVLAANAVDGADLGAVEQRADAFLAGPLVVDLHEGRWTTTEMLALEERVLVTCLDGRQAGAGRAEEGAVARALAARPSLSDEQVAMVRRICTSGDRIDTVVGTPGSGKTVALWASCIPLPGA